MLTIAPILEARERGGQLLATATAERLRAPVTRRLLDQRRTGSTKTPAPSSTMRTFAP